MKQLIAAVILLTLTFGARALKVADMVAHDISTCPVIGTLAPDASKAYSRLPDYMADSVRKEIIDLGKHSAGLAIRFRSDATHIGARWTALNRFNMNHMTPTGIRGVDLYMLDDTLGWTTVGAGRPAQNEHKSSSLIMSDIPRSMREYMLYLPLYDGVDSVYILTDSAAIVDLPQVALPSREGPIVMYGTSILQGGCASRPGMAHTSVVERILNREVINLGFSGNARLEPEMARFMATAPASAFVIDALPNCTADILDERLETFIAIIRASHPTTPVLLVESPMFPASRHSTEVFETVSHKNNVLRSIFEELSANDPNLHYMTADEVLTDPEATVDNYHFTDTGFMSFGISTANRLRSLISNYY